MTHECTKLFMDQLKTLIDYLGFEYPEDNISIIHIGKDEGDRDMYFVSTFPVDNRFQMLIVYWNGVDIYYEEINDEPDLFEYEPKKSLKDECLSLISSIGESLNYCLELKQECGRDAKKDLYKLKELLLKDNT